MPGSESRLDWSTLLSCDTGQLGAEGLDLFHITNVVEANHYDNTSICTASIQIY